MDCRIIAVTQGSESWLDLRRTRITCSRLADVCAGKETKRYTQYRREKIKELLGHKSVEETPEWAEAGKENESRAIAGYEYKYEVEVEHDVFLISKEFDWLGCSPDLLHLPNYDEGVELKIRKLYKNYRRHVQEAELYKGTIRACPASERHQTQGAIWVTGFKRWWHCNYYIGPDLEGGQAQKIHRQAIPRDDKLIEAMEIRCLEFITEVYEGAGLA